MYLPNQKVLPDGTTFWQHDDSSYFGQLPDENRENMMLCNYKIAKT
jgi:hypothetical protein